MSFRGLHAASELLLPFPSLHFWDFIFDSLICRNSDGICSCTEGAPVYPIYNKEHKEYNQAYSIDLFLKMSLSKMLYKHYHLHGGAVDNCEWLCHYFTCTSTLWVAILWRAPGGKPQGPVNSRKESFLLFRIR